MPIDFSDISPRRERTRPITPRDIFNALPAKSAGFGYLREVQGQVLEQWENRRTEHDLAITMNTGTGKTIVGLLILRSCVNEDVGPALYVTPSTYLAEQVQEQAAKLGIATVNDPESHSYLSGESIAVVNVHKLVNGKSVFGGPGSQRMTHIPIGSVVVDDAHAAMEITEAQATITLDRAHPAFDEILDLFRDDLRNQSERKLREIEAGDPSVVARVPFWAWADSSDSVGGILHNYREDDALLFTWPLVADVLSMSQAVLSGSALEIRPPCPPIGRITAFREAARRIYLTATLADDSVLVTHFEAEPDSVRSRIVPTTAADLGDRLILAPQQLNPRLDDDQIRVAIKDLAVHVNVVVLVPSHRQAAQWADHADLTAAADNIANAVAALQSGHVGLVVLVNKYDGIDLPDEACRVLVIDGLPGAVRLSDRRDAEVLRSSEAIVRRQLQRVEQGMGRGVRSVEDYCVVLLLGPALSQLLAQPANTRRLGATTQAQLDLSNQVANQLSSASLEEMLEVVERCLNRDGDWVSISRSILTGIDYSGAFIDESLVGYREAFDLASSGLYSDAVDRLNSAIQSESDNQASGWLMEQLAVYAHLVDPPRAQRILKSGIQRNPNLTRPLSGISYHRISATDNQARSAAEYLSDRYSDPDSLLLGFRTVMSNLAWDSNRTNDFEDAMAELARFLGLSGQRPERDTGNGPDVLWALSRDAYWVIECKSGAETEAIPRRDVAQLAHSMSWFANQYGGEAAALPVLVHPSSVLRRDAAAPPGARIMATNELGNLKSSVKSAILALADGGSWDSPDDVAEQLRHHSLNAGAMVDAFTVAPATV